MAKASDNVFPKVILGTGTAPAAPTDSSWKLYSQANGIYAKSSNTTVGPLGSGGGSGVATDSIWTTSGKVAVATGTATATEQWPPAHEFDYTEYTGGNVSITATTEGTANTVVTGGAVTYDGSTAILVEFYAPVVTTQATSGAHVHVYLYDNGSSIGELAQFTTPAGAAMRGPIHVVRRLTPSNAAHTYSIRAATSAGTATITGGAGGSAAYMPAFIRQVKA